mgnify:FL=1
MKQTEGLTKKDEIVIKLMKDMFSFVDKVETQLDLSKQEKEDMLQVQRELLALLNNHREHFMEIEKDFGKEK